MEGLKAFIFLMGFVFSIWLAVKVADFHYKHFEVKDITTLYYIYVFIFTGIYTSVIIELMNN